MTTTKRWADLLLGEQEPAALTQVARDPVTALRDHFDITATPAASFDQRGDGGACDGVSFTDRRLVLYKQTRSRRENFTLCHELGHHLVDEHDDCLNWCLDQPEAGRVIEQLCDEIAARILIPQSNRSALSRPPRATAVVDLYEQTGASRSACLNVVVDALPSEGFGMLIPGFESVEVFYASRKGDTRPYAWRGDRIPDGHRLQRVADRATCRSTWAYPDGHVRNMYMDAVVHEDWIIALFSDNNIWGVAGGSFVDDGDGSEPFDGEVRCGSCGYSGRTSWYPCPKCQQSPCPRCQECQCDRDERTVHRAMCTNCMSTVRAEQLDEDALCTGCR